MNWQPSELTAFMALVSLGLFVPEAAHAYGGPGSIISGIGTLLAVLAAVAAAILGFFWFPLKRLLQKLRGEGEEQEPEAARAGESLGDG